MALARQPSALPSNKLAVATLIGPTVTEVYGAVMQTVYVPLSGPEASMFAGAMAALAVGYFIPDRSNVARE